MYRNLPQSKLGGQPGTYKLVKSFLRIRQIPHQGPEVELIDDQPVWAMIFYCLRCGDMEDALMAARKAQ